jgi:hypothetical protein
MRHGRHVSVNGQTESSLAAAERTNSVAGRDTIRMSGITTTLTARATDLAGTSPAGALTVVLPTSAHAGPRARRDGKESSSMTYLTFLVSCAYTCLGVNLRTGRKEYALETLKIDAEVCAYAQRRVKGVAGAQIKRNWGVIFRR